MTRVRIPFVACGVAVALALGAVTLASGTAWAEEDRSNRLIEAGAKGMIHKPYKSEQLAARIRAVLTESVWSST